MPVYNLRGPERTLLTQTEGLGVLTDFVSSVKRESTFKVPTDKKDEFKRVLQEGRSYFRDIASMNEFLKCDWENGHALFSNAGGHRLEGVLAKAVNGLGATDSLCSSHLLALQLVIDSQQFIKPFMGVAHVLGLFEAIYPDSQALIYDRWVAQGDAGFTPYGGSYSPDYYPMAAFSVSIIDRGVRISITHEDEHEVVQNGEFYGYDHAPLNGREASIPADIAAHIVFSPQQDVCPTKDEMHNVIQDFLVRLQATYDIERFVPEERWERGRTVLRMAAPHDKTVLDRIGIGRDENNSTFHQFFPSRNLYT